MWQKVSVSDFKPVRNAPMQAAHPNSIPWQRQLPLHGQFFGKLKSDVRNYIQGGKPEYARRGPIEKAVVLPAGLESAINGLYPEEAESLRLFINLETQRHFGEYCQKMEKLFPGLFVVFTRNIYYFRSYDTYIWEEELEAFMRKHPDAGEPEKMTGLGAVRKPGRLPLLPKEKAAEGYKELHLMYDRMDKICEIVDCLQARYFKAIGIEADTGHTDRGGFMSVFWPVMSRMEYLLAPYMKEKLFPSV